MAGDDVVKGTVEYLDWSDNDTGEDKGRFAVVGMHLEDGDLVVTMERASKTRKTLVVKVGHNTKALYELLKDHFE